jgi:HAD superfamily hydrolase (TIGR01549 family)
MAIHAILFDVIGTSVMEKDPSIITRCFVKAFADRHILVDEKYIATYRGLDKREAISAILQVLQRPLSLADTILEAFNNNVADNIHNFSENNELRKTIEILKQRKIVIGVGTGLSSDIFQLIFNKLNWSSLRFDYIGIAEKVGRGRPHPDMLLEMMKENNIDPTEFLKVGDTVADIQEGKNAGVLTAAILSGTTVESKLREENPDFIINGLGEIIAILDSKK